MKVKTKSKRGRTGDDARAIQEGLAELDRCMAEVLEALGEWMKLALDVRKRASRKEPPRVNP